MRLLLVLIVANMLSGCVTSRIEQSRDAVTGISSDEAMVLLGRASYNEKQTEESFTDCIADVLNKGDQSIRLIAQQQFKDDLYPWFEPRTAPTSADELGRLFAQPGVKERIDDETYTYIGDIKNTGGVRADFVRIIYHFWADDTSPILSDSVYIDGSNHVYLNGVISDANIDPMEFGKFSFTINLPDSLDIEYHTKEIKWDIFN